MIFIWGRQVVERKKGWVADYCPKCGDIQSFKLFRMGMASHVFFISVSEGDLVGYVGTCNCCGHTMEVDATRYQAVQEEKPSSLESLIAKTFPSVRAFYDDSFGAQNGQETAELIRQQTDREQMIMAPFRQLTPMVEARFGRESGKFDFESGLGCLGTIVLAVSALLVILLMNFSKFRQFILALLAVLVPLGMIYTVVQMALVDRRFVARKVLPPLAVALQPLAPTRAELADCLAKLKNLNMKIGHKVNVDALWAEIQLRNG
jgi:hypothetical protein